MDHDAITKSRQALAAKEQQDALLKAVDANSKAIAELSTLTTELVVAVNALRKPAKKSEE